MQDEYINRVDQEVSLQEIINFFIESWLIILTTIIISLFAATAYLVITPNEFQAVAYIQVARFQDNGRVQWVNYEEPKLLLTRFKVPSVYTEEEIKACGFVNQGDPAKELAMAARFTEIRGGDSLVELKINRPTKDLAKSCATTIFQKIYTHQSQMIKARSEIAKDSLMRYQKQLKGAQELISRADHSTPGISVAYLSVRDELRHLNDEVIKLSTFISALEAGQARLIAPIYASDNPILPRSYSILMSSFISGFLLGIFLAFIRRWMR